MTPGTWLTSTRPPGAAFAQLLACEARIAWRVPVGLLLGVAAPIIVLIVFGNIPGMNVDACFVVVEPGQRIVFTNALDSRWRPAHPAPVVMTAEITLGDHPDGTDYRVRVRHTDAEPRSHHEKLGFADGWGSTADQLAALVEGSTGRP